MNLFDWLRSLWNQYLENKKWRAFYDRLDRNKEGRFSQKKYIRQLNKTVRTEREKKLGKQQDVKK
jgi:hypothetical protein